MLTRSRHRGVRFAGVIAALAMAAAAGTLLAPPASADTVRSTEAWVLSALNVQQAWSVTQGQGVVVAVIDSGVDSHVSDLTGQVHRGPDFTGVRTPPSSNFWGVHGTWMGSLIAGHGHGPGDASGIVGVAPQSKILSIRVITDADDPNASAYERQSAPQGQHELARAITYAVHHGASVISMSLGYSLQSAAVRAALQDAFTHNVVVVASAGNSGEQSGASGSGHAPYSYPADYPGVLAVGAVTSAGQPASFSSENLSVQVAAPGFQVPAQGRDGAYWLVSGTSPACALTAGVVALIKAKYPHLTDTKIISAIITSTTPGSRPKGGYNDRVGFGEVNAAAAVTTAGKLAGERAQPAGGLQPTAHFGGGTAAIPAPPVQSRGIGTLLLYCLLGVCCLGLVAVAVSRMFALHDRPGRRTAMPADSAAESLVPRITAGPPGRHAAPRIRGDDPAEQ